jgi:hypothetical protein
MSIQTDKRERLRFQYFAYKPFVNGRCSTEVKLEFDGREFDGSAEGTQTLEGQLRCGALAAVEAAEEATDRHISLELLGVKAVRAFDQWIVIVSVRGRTDEQAYRLIGSFATAERDAARGAALAVLDATNRILERYLDR